MKKKLLRLILVLVVLFIIIQFIPTHFNPASFDTTQDIMAEENVPDSVAILIKNACYDCHSFETKFPWYANMAPVSWMLKSHIKNGRQNMNLSIWGTYPKSKKIAIVGEIIEVVDTKRMPLKSYTWMHPKARLTDEQRQQIAGWGAKEEVKLTKSN